MSHWIVMDSSTLHNTCQIGSIETFHPVINCTKRLKLLAYTPLKLPSNLVLYIKFPSCQFLFSFFPLPSFLCIYFVVHKVLHSISHSHNHSISIPSSLPLFQVPFYIFFRFILDRKATDSKDCFCIVPLA